MCIVCRVPCIVYSAILFNSFESKSTQKKHFFCVFIFFISLVICPNFTQLCLNKLFLHGSNLPHCASRQYSQCGDNSIATQINFYQNNYFFLLFFFWFLNSQSLMGSCFSFDLDLHYALQFSNTKYNEILVIHYKITKLTKVVYGSWFRFIRRNIDYYLFSFLALSLVLP